MNWEAIGAIGEIVGAAGVILTLGYLAFQIRQNTKQLTQNELASRASAAHASANAIQGARRSVYENSEVAEIWSKGMSHPDELSEIEYLRFRLMMLNGIDGIWEVHFQNSVTGLSQEIWESLGVKIAERIVATPGGRRVWAQVSDAYTEEFRVAMDRILES